MVILPSVLFYNSITISIGHQYVTARRWSRLTIDSGLTKVHLDKNFSSSGVEGDHIDCSLITRLLRNVSKYQNRLNFYDLIPALGTLSRLKNVENWLFPRNSQTRYGTDSIRWRQGINLWNSGRILRHILHIQHWSASFQIANVRERYLPRCLRVLVNTIGFVQFRYTDSKISGKTRLQAWVCRSSKHSYWVSDLDLWPWPQRRVFINDPHLL